MSLRLQTSPRQMLRNQQRGVQMEETPASRQPPTQPKEKRRKRERCLQTSRDFGNLPATILKISTAGLTSCSTVNKRWMCCIRIAVFHYWGGTKMLVGFKFFIIYRRATWELAVKPWMRFCCGILCVTVTGKSLRILRDGPVTSIRLKRWEHA